MGLTDDPSPVVEEPIKLPKSVTCEVASQRLGEMAAVVVAALDTRTSARAARQLEALYGPELEAIHAREKTSMNRFLANPGPGTAAAGLPFTAPRKRTSSHGS